MSSPWVPVFVPLVKGLDVSRDANLGSDELHTALNVDYTVDGQVRGRPSRTAPAQFKPRNTSTSSGGGYETAGNTPTFMNANGLLRISDGNGERPAVGFNGRLFTREDTDFIDRGHFACTRVDRLHNFQKGHQYIVDERAVMTRDFGAVETTGTGLAAGQALWGLLNSSGALDRTLNGATVTDGKGNGAASGSTTAVVTRGSTGNIKFTYRTAGALTLTTTTPYSGGAALSPADEGDAPSICGASDGTPRFWVAYRLSSGASDTFMVLALSAVGAVTATYTSGSITGLHGIWISAAPTQADAVVVAFTHTDGITCRTLNSTTLVDASADSTYAQSGTLPGLEVVVGCQDPFTAWFAYKQDAPGLGDIIIGKYSIGVASSIVNVDTLFGGAIAAQSDLTWAICHQPIMVGYRMYLTLAAATGGQETATWITLDLSNRSTTPDDLVPGQFPVATIVAQGPPNSTYPHLQPSAAVMLQDGTGWTFATQDWTQLSTSAITPYYFGLSGAEATAGLNRVTMSGPRTASAGATTVFSGNVPHMVAGGGDCYELGFPFLNGTPGMAANVASGGTIPIGDYGIQVCWRWTDHAGQVHRSAPSAISIASPTGGSQKILVFVTNPWLCAKRTETVIEVYATDVNPTADAPHFLQGAFACDFAAATTLVTLDGSPAMTVTSDPLYTEGGVLANYPVRGDGGVAVVGRRLWMADEHTAYGSKYLTPGVGPSFNDEGTNQVTIPAGAGRILSLETLDDKVVVFCERGVFFIQDGGPDDTGVGSPFQPPVRLSDLSIAGPRSSCATDAGVLFCTSLDATDASRGGPWLLDRQLTFSSRQFIGRPAADYFLNVGSWVPEVAYSPERQQAYITTPSANGTSDGVVVLDFRTEKWSVWDTVSATLGALRHIVVVDGILWALNNEPGAYSGAPGTDLSANGAYAMVVKTAHIASDGRDALGWSRVRSVRPLGGEGGTAHTLTMTAVMDGTRTYTSSAVAVATPTTDTTWPTTRTAPEWRLPTQKCSTVQVQLSASPATARWSAIRLDVAPLPKAAPPRSRS